MPVQMYIRAFTRAPDVHMSFVDSLVQVPAARAAVLGSIGRSLRSRQAVVKLHAWQRTTAFTRQHSSKGY